MQAFLLGILSKVYYIQFNIRAGKNVETKKGLYRWTLLVDGFVVSLQIENFLYTSDDV